MIHRFLRRWLPRAQTIRSNRALGWLAPVMGRRWLWRIDGRGLALGTAAGVFFGLLIPVAQIPLAAVAAYVMRANLPAAVAATLISNPFTYVPIYIFAHHIGTVLLGVPEVPLADVMPAQAADGWWAHVTGIGEPLLLGLFTLAVVATAVAYVGMRLVWRFGVTLQAVRFKRRAAARRGADGIGGPPGPVRL
jgi:uncharacterized protein (DUF2062 family)